MQHEKEEDAAGTGGGEGGDVKIGTAILSVADKSGLVEFARGLRGYGVALLATGGTYSALKEAGVEVRSLGDAMGLSEALSGRVKTLHSNLFAGILAKRGDAGHMRELGEMKVAPIDMVVCNFYPFEKVASDPMATDETLIENIDIGGPSMVRASTKNHLYVTVVPSPRFYAPVLDELSRRGGRTSLALRRSLAVESLAITAAYDSMIYNELRRRFSAETGAGWDGLPGRFLLAATKFQDARYGENPDQRAAIYSVDGVRSMTEWKQLSGEALSFNNYLDIGSAYEIIDGFEDRPTAATVKHGQISGFAFAATLARAYSLAHACDPEADFGGTVVLNRRVDEEAAKLIGKNEGEDDGSVYTEIVIAPGYDEPALDVLRSKQKKKIRMIQTGKERPDYRYDMKELEGAVLLQEPADYRKRLDARRLEFPTTAKPDQATLQKLLAAWEVVRRVQSNGIVVADGSVSRSSPSEGGRLEELWTLGVASFRKRSGAVKIALDNAGSRSKGAVCASDGFFPFRDNIDLLGRAGVTAVIQPGGSINDPEVVSAADECGMAMAITRTRAFKH